MSGPLRALIVDDERLARAELARLLDAHPELSVVGVAADADEATRRVAELDPDVVFLDIQLPGGTAFDVLAQVRSRARVVFVTAFDVHALRAFDVEAVDYLLKPVHPERLARTVARLLGEDAHSRDARCLAPDDHLWVESERSARFVRVRSIACVLGAGDYTEIVTDDGKTSLTLHALKDWEQRLPRRLFVRSHRSALINLEKVLRVERDGDDSFRVTLRGLDRGVPMSRRRAARLRSALRLP